MSRPVPVPQRRRVGVFFGGVSPEHEVSVISALQAMAALNAERWEVCPVYVAKNGAWWTGDALRDPETFKGPMAQRDDLIRVSILPSGGGSLHLMPLGSQTRWPWRRAPEPIAVDIVLPVMHGGSGEDGSLQGLLETARVAYAGSDPMAAALAMDKVAAKRWAAGFGIPQVAYVALSEDEWADHEEDWLDRLEDSPGLPCIVKPAHLGSSIGISRATSRQELDAAVEEAFRYDASVVVEQAVPNLRELNCSVLGRAGNAEASVLEEPLSGAELLSFRDKYLSGGKSGRGVPLGRKSRPEGMASLDRSIPAQVPDALTSAVRDLAVRVFEAFGCEGVVRIDFLLNDATGAVYFNEINTVPGSLSFYLWEPSGVPFETLLDRILDLGLARHGAQAGRIHTYDVNLLSERDLGGLKGTKG